VRHQVDVIFVGVDWLDCRADGDRALKLDGDRRQQRVVGPRKPVPYRLIALSRELVLRGGNFEALAGTLDQSGEIGLPHQVTMIHVVHCSAFVFADIYRRAGRAL
jgi:hypothetical protein